MTVGNAGKVEVLAFAVTSHFAASPTVVDCCFAATACPTGYCAAIVATFNSTSREAVLDEEGGLAACVGTEDTCCLLNACVDITHVAEVTKGDSTIHLVGSTNKSGTLSCRVDGAGLVEQ